jgi:hypothetical protein
MTKEGFCKEMTGDNNHRLLLWRALECTKGKVVEFGSGWGSTPYLREYCLDSDRPFETYDNGKDWAERQGSTYVSDWDSIDPKGSVILIDHAPGERRWYDVRKLLNNFDIFVIHDSEPEGAGNYQLENIWHLFKYRVDVKTVGAWATAVSNTIDVREWVGESFGNYKIG